MVYAIAAYAIIGINVNAHADKLLRSNDAVEAVEAVPAAVKPQPFVRPSGGFLNSWR